MGTDLSSNARSYFVLWGLAPISLPRAGRDLVNMAKKRPNVIPIIEDARHPARYRMLLPMVSMPFTRRVSDYE